MMNTVTEHYDQHLGPVYSWMVGDIKAALIRSDAELEMPELPPTTTGKAVVAIDSCKTLLNELGVRTGTLPIRRSQCGPAKFP